MTPEEKIFEQDDRKMALAVLIDAEREFRQSHAFNAADLYASVISARKRAMAVGIDVLPHLYRTIT